MAQIARSKSLQNGFLFGLVVLLVAGFVEWEGWAGTRSQAAIDVIVAALLFVFWVSWTLYSRSRKDGGEQ